MSDNYKLDLYEFGLSTTNLLNAIEQSNAGERIDLLNVSKEEVALIVSGLTMLHSIGDELKELRSLIVAGRPLFIQ